MPARLGAAGYFEMVRLTRSITVTAGRSIVLTHQGLMEWTVDHEDVEQINADKAATAHDELRGSAAITRQTTNSFIGKR